MGACDKTGVQVLVLDRPNPINGLTTEGPVLDPAYKSFVGMLIPRFSAATRRGQHGLEYGVVIETPASGVQRVFGSTRWKIVDTGGGLHRWQVDLYWGEDEPLGPGRFMGRPHGTTFEYAYSDAKVK